MKIDTAPKLAGVILQMHDWQTTPQNLWNEVSLQSPSLAQSGFEALYLPPASKAMDGANDVGYQPYDLYDLGEFDQKNSIGTKYGTKDEYINAISNAHSAGLKVYADIVFNHRAGADSTEIVSAIKKDWGWRDQDAWNGQSHSQTPVDIEVWTKFDFEGRNGKYSQFTFNASHFDGVNYAHNYEPATERTWYLWQFEDHTWDNSVDGENGNYDYLLHADLDFDNEQVKQELKTWGEWFLKNTQVDGFRLDAVKHIKFEYVEEWITAMRELDSDLFAVGEYWHGDVNVLNNYIDKTHGTVSLFDVALHYRLRDASSWNGYFDMSKIFDGSLVQSHPNNAVTFVDNHDTQDCSSLESPVLQWFKTHAHALILLRGEGKPMVFSLDYYGGEYDCNGQHRSWKSNKIQVDLFLLLRQIFRKAIQTDYLDHEDIIGWTKVEYKNKWIKRSMSVVMTDRYGGEKTMDMKMPNQEFVDILGNHNVIVTSDATGIATFPVNGGSIGVWVEKNTFDKLTRQ
eukprot:Awhi_evm1s15016